MPNHIVLFQPEIPANTGNIARTCLATDSELHLIRPLGFSTDDKMLRRAGLDYWHDVKIHYYDSIEELYEKYPKGDYYYIENFGTKSYADFDFQSTEDDLLFVFGRESDGIPKSLLEGLEDKCLRIPMTGQVRSLNLSNTVSIILFETLRQQGFKGLIK
ncbi:tRNA (uridine(34)/cytosine(34)/5-carboxymethylaminomethyluridine(34)-2'-O)-methyltransferase TrmL [Halobacillus litoralis]|uniref:tRNA (uridine(34)/cytosine(34)/5- carboxymethylaminomethyluridine(34)-2'-O)- methyltransferase TrmL n=1 Tax=Halobacillus litoralis TaxID=45668 RepID=UPI001CD3E716|nr:tRNA (uridine(34)/cytosine(34)/5-carboxymethylaminomethyluridine(34)-2'-O)-methyltransferase TrmL [Halobacillus litoralis]MCA0969784.1 tRNA (uridine(34)/cytosine(34)/5-carboxymethylaminomethyluridine(34)-2'-O)-methyltransferase TrmL [Halobacillus litoralis]